MDSFRVISDYPTKIDIEVINGIKLDNDWLVQQDKRFMIFCKAWNLYEVMVHNLWSISYGSSNCHDFRSWFQNEPK